MSSPVLTIAARRSGPATSASPRASLAPPVPPVRITMSGLLTSSLPQLLGQARQADARVDLVAGVDGDQQRGERLGRARHLQLAAVHAAQTLDALDQRGRLSLVRARVAAHEHVLPERLLQVAERGGADGV